MRKRIVVLLLIAAAVAAVGVAVLAVARFRAAERNRMLESASEVSKGTNAEAWDQAVARVKADRGEPAAGSAGIEIPPELKHYSDRHWFLATQVAEIEKYNVQTCQDYMDLATMIQRGEMVAVPTVTDTYVLFGVGAKADGGVFTRYQDDKSIELYDEAQLIEAYKSFDNKRSSLQSEIESLKVQASKLNKRDRAKQNELQKQLTVRQAELKSTDEDKALLDQSYG